MKGLARGDTLELRIEKGVYRGLGLARHEGQVVFVPRAVPGDLVRARIEKARAGYVEARLESLVERLGRAQAFALPLRPALRRAAPTRRSTTPARSG